MLPRISCYGKISSNMRLSVILPTVRAWPAIEAALAAALRQDFSEPFEVLVLDGHGGALAREPQKPVRWIREPGAEVFQLRASGIMAARGEVIVFSEDHCVAPPDWHRRTSAAHREQCAPVLIGPVRNHRDSARRAVDRANFALTLGPFAPPLEALPTWRLPVPTNLSIKRAALPSESKPSGWLEYDFLADELRGGRIAVAEDAVLDHLQNWRAYEALVVHFHSGRSYGASVQEWAAIDRRVWWSALPSIARRLYRFTAPALKPDATGAPASLADRSWLLSLVLANIAGQALGALAGPGVSRQRLG